MHHRHHWKALLGVAAAGCFALTAAGAEEAEGPYPTGRPTYAQLAAQRIPPLSSSGRETKVMAYTDVALPFADKFLVYAAQEPGDFIEQQVSVETDGRYQVELWVPRGPKCGVFIVVVDGRRLGAELDAYANPPQPPQRWEVGTLDLKAGTHRIKLVVIDKNPRSAGHEIWTDGYLVRPRPAGAFIDEWQVAGPFPLDSPLAPSPPEGAQWKAAKPEADGKLDFAEVIGNQENVTAWAQATVYSPADEDGYLWLGSDDGVTVWLNGKQVHRNPAERPALPDQDLARVHWVVGENRLVFRVDNVLADWALYARPHDPGGRMRAIAPPRQGLPAGVTPQQREAVQRLATRVRGFIVWESNRTGSWELYRCDTDGSNLQQLTQLGQGNPAAYQGYLRPQVSPDGSTILFAYGRGQGRPEVWTVPATGGAAARLTAGTPLNWSPDGKEIYFVRDSQLYRRVVASGQESTVQPTKLTISGMDRGTVGAVSPDLQTVVYRSPRSNEVFSLAAGKTIRTTAGSEIRCTVDGQYIYWVQGPKHFRVWAPQADKEWEFFGEPPTERWNYTYFPTVSADNRWLVYGASPNQHSHETSDYEIFIQELDNWKPVGDPVRLTWDEHTDRWPFLWLHP